MSIESRAQRHHAKHRRPLVIVAALAAFVLLATGGVAVWSADSWREQAMSAGVFPDPPGDGWADTSSPDGWDSSTGTSTSWPGTSGSATAGAATATVVPAGGPSSQVPTSRAPRPSSTQPTPPPTTTSTAAPSPTKTNSGPRHKPKPSPPNKPVPTSNPGDSCLLLVIC